MPQFERRPLAAAMALLFAAPAAMAAQTAPEAPAQSSERTLPEVNVLSTPDGSDFRTDTTRSGTRTETPLRDVPQFINVVPQSVIRSQNATTLQDALRNVPGITYAAAEGGTTANQLFYLRGFQSGGNLFIDGVRDIGEYNRDLFATEAVEVIKGSGGLLFGRGSTAGVINQVTKLADLIPRREVAFTVGSFDTRRTTADLNFVTGANSAVRLVALAEDSGSFRNPNDVERLGFAPSLSFGIGTPTQITLAHYYLKTSDITDYGQPTLFTKAAGFFGLPPVSARAYYGFANHDFTDHETNISTLTLDHRFTQDLSLRNTLRFASYQRDMEATIATLNKNDSNGIPVTPATPLANLLVNRVHTKARDADDTALINQTELTWKVATGALKHTVLGGVELARERLDRQNYTFAGTTASLTPLLSPTPETPLSYSKTPSTNPRADADTVAIYGQDQIEFNPQWKGVFGLRWERYDTEVVTTNVAMGAVTAGPFARVDKMLSGRAGVIWQPTNAQSYYVSYGNSYNPSGELGVYGGTATNLTANTLAVDPEKNNNYEAGAQWDFFSNTRLRASVYRNEKSNARMNDPTDPTGTTQILAGKQRVDGLELELAGRINRNWDIFSAYAFMDGRVLEGNPNIRGKHLTIPEHSGNIWTVYRLGGGWEVGGGFAAASTQAIDAANTPNAELPSYWRWDATIAYVQKKYEVRLNVVNLTDELYYIGGYQNSPNRVLPATPRAAFVSVAYRFD